jgi:hypothetical protein
VIGHHNISEINAIEKFRAAYKFICTSSRIPKSLNNPSDLEYLYLRLTLIHFPYLYLIKMLSAIIFATLALTVNSAPQAKGTAGGLPATGENGGIGGIFGIDVASLFGSIMGTGSVNTRRKRRMVVVSLLLFRDGLCEPEQHYPKLRRPSPSS